MMKVTVLISGRGSNLEALLENQTDYQIVHVISNKPDIRGLTIAKAHGVVNSYLNWQNSEHAELMASEIIEQEQSELVILAGFMKILSSKFVQRHRQKIINIHPSLLPKYPGLHTHQQVIDHGDLIHGASVHLVDEQLDHGAVIAQTKLTVEPKDDALTLAEKLIAKEHKLLTQVVSLIAQQHIKLNHQGISVNDQPLLAPMIID